MEKSKLKLRSPFNHLINEDRIYADLLLFFRGELMFK